MYYLIYGLLYLFSLLPFPLIYGVSDLIYLCVYYLFGYRKKEVMNNLTIAFPEKSLAERIVIAKKFYRNLTDTFLEAIKLMSISEKEFQKRVTINLDEVIRLAEKGKRIQFHCGHQFGWEWGNWIIAQKMKIPWVGIYMKISNKSIDKIFYNIRSRQGTILIAVQDFKNSMHKVLDKQYSIGLAADQNPGIPSNAYWLNFFNRPAPFVTGPDKAAIKNNSAVVFVKFVKLQRGYYKFETEIIKENSKECLPGEITIAYRNFLEKTIREQPDNYLWSHRRWKWPYKKEYQERWIDNKPATLD